MNRIKLKSFLRTANVALLLSAAVAGTAQDKLLAFPGAEGGGCYVTAVVEEKSTMLRRSEDDARNTGIASLRCRPERSPHHCFRCGRYDRT